jgi:uncharacterized protein YkwD
VRRALRLNVVVVGVADRDYMRQQPGGGASAGRTFALVLTLVVAVLFLSGYGQRGIRWARAQTGHQTQGQLRLSVGGVLLAVSAPGSRNDPWSAYLAPEELCPGRNNDLAAPAVQQQTAICMLNFARQHAGLPALLASPLLSGTSASKAAAIARCDDFAHAACGRPADEFARAAGYRGALGENIYAGVPTFNSPLAAVDGWLNSPHHRENLFRAEWKTQGIALLHVDRLKANDDVAVWVSEFGT